MEQSDPIEAWDDDVKRRVAIQLVAALGAGTAIPPGALENVLSGIEDALGNPLDLAEWEHAVHEYGFLINRQPVGSLINDLTTDIVSVGELLQSDHARPTRPELLRVSAGLATLLAIELGDIGNRRGARLAWGTARRASDQSGDQALRVMVRAREAEEGFWAGLSPHDIGALAVEAVKIAEGTSSAGLPRAYAVRASLAAEFGDIGTARTHGLSVRGVRRASPHRDRRSHHVRLERGSLSLE